MQKSPVRASNAKPTYLACRHSRSRDAVTNTGSRRRCAFYAATPPSPPPTTLSQIRPCRASIRRRRTIGSHNESRQRKWGSLLQCFVNPNRPFPHTHTPPPHSTTQHKACGVGRTRTDNVATNCASYPCSVTCLRYRLPTLPHTVIY